MILVTTLMFDHPNRVIFCYLSKFWNFHAVSVFHVLVYEHYAYCQSNKISHHIPFEYISTYNVFAYRVNNISIIITVLRSIVTIARRKYIFRNVAIAWQLRENPILVCITYCSISVTIYTLLMSLPILILPFLLCKCLHGLKKKNIHVFFVALVPIQ